MEQVWILGKAEQGWKLGALLGLILGEAELGLILGEAELGFSEERTGQGLAKERAEHCVAPVLFVKNKGDRNS